MLDMPIFEVTALFSSLLRSTGKIHRIMGKEKRWTTLDSNPSSGTQEKLQKTLRSKVSFINLEGRPLLEMTVIE